MSDLSSNAGSDYETERRSAANAVQTQIPTPGDEINFLCQERRQTLRSWPQPTYKENTQSSNAARGGGQTRRICTLQKGGKRTMEEKHMSTNKDIKTIVNLTDVHLTQEEENVLKLGLICTTFQF